MDRSDQRRLKKRPTNFVPIYEIIVKERDQETGNDYFDARYYSSTMGRFMSPDWSAKAEPVPYAKLGDPQSLNLFSYVRNNPTIFADSDGHAIASTALQAAEESLDALEQEATVWANSMAQQQVSAKASGTSVTYTYPDGSTIVMSGTHPWRDNNPGNEIAGPGVVGKDKGFVIFATAEDGWNALSANLQGHMNDTILGTITARTPKDDGKDPMLKGNDPVAYAGRVASSIGVPASTRLSALSPAQFTQLVVGVASQEGYFAQGNTMTYNAGH